ncbi:hypothetical protein HPB50_018734 [Hyalomma asiaticum]|uniref:Uncharacterized protein n=1 Tax=Hyalomma asiaticum TaxID=266040 RepID=A0ACB7RXC0_HYAAI|nr:hypothetical protein HPB50_018734 [Hyalomma asiaticum]
MPPTSSIIGHKELRHPNFHREKALEWAKEYGPAYRLKMYLRDVVVLNDFESIKKFSAHDEILHRPDIMNFGLDYNKERHLVGNIKMFIIGGIDGPSVSMQLCLVIFAARPTEIQRRIQREIDAVIRQGKLPTWDERKRMPFTLACVWELERWKRTEPFGLPRGTGADMVVDNFFVPKGSVVLFNLWKVNRDPSLWKNPHHFDPGRFLQEDGSLIPEKPSYHVGFSFGQAALGETGRAASSTQPAHCSPVRGRLDIVSFNFQPRGLTPGWEN